MVEMMIYIKNVTAHSPTYYTLYNPSIPTKNSQLPLRIVYSSRQGVTEQGVKKHQQRKKIEQGVCG